MNDIYVYILLFSYIYSTIQFEKRNCTNYADKLTKLIEKGNFTLKIDSTVLLVERQ